MTAILEDAEEIRIDKWGSLNTAASPGRLPEGQSPNNQNVWMDEKPGSIVTANGYQKLGENPSGNPTTFLINYFKTSDGSQTLVLSDGVTVWKTTNYVDFTEIKTGLSSFFQLRGMVIRDKLWLTNGSDPVMTYDGATLTVLDGTGGTPDVPAGKYISYHDERVWIYGISGEPSSLRFSDLTDTSGTEITPDDAGAWPADNELKISEGDADIGTGLFVYRGYLYASKSFSIWRIVGYDEYTYTKVKTRSSTGTRFAESIREVDNLVHFIGVDGLYTFNGEESQRISDIIDPANPDPGVFAFRNLQQPLLSNQFWNNSSTTDFGLRTVSENLDHSNDRITLKAKTDSEAEFATGSKTRVSETENPGYLQLSIVSAGSSGTLVSSGKSASLDTNGSYIGISSYVTDGNDTNKVGFRIGSENDVSQAWAIDLGSAMPIGRIDIKNFYSERGQQIDINEFRIESSSDGTNWTIRSEIKALLPSSVLHGTGPGVFEPYATGYYSVGPSTITTDISTVSARYWRLFMQSDGPSYSTITELELYRAGFESDGKYVSASSDYVSAPTSFGTLAASIVTSGEAYQFFTQSSDDNSTWDAEVNVSNGGAIGSALKRYLRWGVYLYSSTGVSTPVIDKVFLSGLYVSQVFDTGGGIYQWGAFQLATSPSGQTITAYFRAAATSGGVLAQSWTAIVNGAIPNTATTNSFIQFKLEISTTDASMVPYVTGITFNWTLGSAGSISTLQNVASFVWLNRYWLSAATIGADSNDVIIVRGKSTFGSPFHKKDFSILSFCRFQDYFIGGSSTNGDILRLETGYSKDGAVMDSFYETQDYDKSGFLMKLLEIIVGTDRSGPYNLNVGVSTDGGITYTEKTIDLTRTSLTQNAGFVKKLIIGSFMADKFRVRFRINAADQPFSVDSAIVYYRISPVRGSLN